MALHQPTTRAHMHMHERSVDSTFSDLHGSRSDRALWFSFDHGDFVRFPIIIYMFESGVLLVVDR